MHFDDSKTRFEESATMVSNKSSWISARIDKLADAVLSCCVYTNCESEVPTVHVLHYGRGLEAFLSVKFYQIALS